MIKLFRKKSTQAPPQAPPQAPLQGASSAPAEKRSSKGVLSKLFRKKTVQLPVQKESSLPLKEKAEKREYLYLLEFRCRGQLFASVESSTVPNGVFKIGKSSSSDLVIPEKDRICSENHLELHFSARGLKAQAVPGNYFYCNSRKGTAVNLKLYDRIAFGDCELNIKESVNDEYVFSEAHRLEFTNGEKKGEMILLEKDLIRIGSDPENDIVLKQDVISRFHARIKIAENGECWIQDLQSVNGTFVNDVKLGAQERMLMDSDEISFASVSLLFLDRKVLHTRSQIGKKFAALGITLGSIAFLFALFYAVTPHASQLLIAAEYYIAGENFAAAQRMLDKMPHSKDYSNFKEHHQAFDKRLSRYRDTLEKWEKFKRNLQTSQWNRAMEIYGMLEENDRLAWNWSENSAEQKMGELKHAKLLLNIHFDIQSILYSSDLTLEQKKTRFSEIQKIKLTDLKKEISWLQALRKEIAENLKKLTESVDLWQKAETLLEQLGAANCNMGQMITEMEKLYAASMGSVRTRIFDVLDVLKQLHENDKVIQQNQKALLALRFPVIRQSVAFVPQDECVIDQRLIRKRYQLIATHRKVLAVAGNIKLQYQKLRDLGVRGEKFPAAIEKMLTEKNLGALIEDPFASSETAVRYDRFFGCRYFYWHMQESARLSDNVYSDGILSTLKEFPSALKIREVFKAAETSHIYLQTLKKEALYKERIEAFDKQCVRLLERRKKLIGFFRQKVRQNKDCRSGLIARMAVFYFSTPGSINAAEMKVFSECWKKYQAEIQGYFREYDPLDSSKMQKLRQKIRKRSLPGDPAASLFRSTR